MGGIIIASTMGNDRSRTNSTCAVVMVGLIHRVVSYARTRWSHLGRLIDGVRMWRSILWIPDRPLGRKRLFLVTVATYSLATLASAFSWSFWSFAILRAFTDDPILDLGDAIDNALRDLFARWHTTLLLLLNDADLAVSF
jgi:MFS family permease